MCVVSLFCSYSPVPSSQKSPSLVDSSACGPLGSKGQVDIIFMKILTSLTEGFLALPLGI